MLSTAVTLHKTLHDALSPFWFQHTKKEQREQKSQAINSHHLFMKLNNLSNAEKNEDLAIYFSLYNYKADRPAEFIT